MSNIVNSSDIVLLFFQKPNWKEPKSLSFSKYSSIYKDTTLSKTISGAESKATGL